VKSYAIQEIDTIKTHYKSLSSIEKIIYFDKLSYYGKRTYKDFFYRHLPLLLLDEKIQSNKNDLIKLKFSLVDIYSIKENNAKAIQILKEIENDKEYRLSDSEYMILLIRFRKAYISLNLYSKAFKVNSEIEKLRKKGVYSPLWYHNFKSDLYAKLFLYNKVIPQLKLEIKELIKNPKRENMVVVSAYNNLGFYYMKNNQIDSAFYYYKLSLKLSETELKPTKLDDYNRLQSTVKGNLGELYSKLKDYKTAIPLIKEDLAFSLKSNENANNSIRSILLLSECYSHLKNYAEAENILKIAEKLIQKEVDPSEKMQYYRVKAQLLKSLNKTDEAYILFEKALQLNDSINISRKQLLAENEILYHLEEKDSLTEQQRLDLINKQQNMFLLLILGLSIIVISSFYYVYSSKKKRKEIQKMNLEISNQNKVIQDSLSEKEILLKEIHHRVKNNLQIISGILELQKLNITDPNIKLVFQEGQARIQSIALVHKTLYQSENFSSVYFHDYLTELVSAIENTYKRSTLKVDSFINAEGIELGINTAIPLSLIINEIVTNCFKHAFRGRKNGNLFIRLIKSNGSYILTIEDDGNGLSKNFNLLSLKSVGFDLIQGLTKQIGGTFEWQSENGTRITITFEDN
jgi:two-component sensor histidine kinase